MAKLRIGILGGGGILGAHAPGFAAAKDRCTVTAAAEPVAERHPRIKELLGDQVTLYDDYQTLLAEADVDAVDILLPHDLHMPAAVAAAEAGRHVLVEKVMARNVWECDRMIEACEAAGVTLTVCHDRRYAAEWIALKDVVDSGLLGEIHYWKLDHNQNVNPASGLVWAATRDGIGGGSIMSCLTHQIDALRWYGGEVASVTCMTKTVPERMEGERIGVIVAKMASGALAHVAINWETSSSGGANALWYEMVHVTGTTGEAYYMSGSGTFVRLHDGTDVREHFEIDGEVPDVGLAKIKTEPSWNHIRCISEWLNMLLGRDNSISTSGRDVRGTVEVAEAAYMSEATGRVVTLPIEPKPWGSR